VSTPHVLMSYLHYPLSVARFFKWAFLRLGCEVFSVGPFRPDIPWAPAMDFSPYWDIPNLSMPQELTGDLRWVLRHPDVVAFQPDLLVQIDAGYYLQWDPRPLASEKENQLPLTTVHVATDPHCVSGNTLLATDYGIMFAKEVVGIPHLCVYGERGQEQCAGVIQSAFKPTRKLILETGQELVCTDDHEVKTPDGFKRADKLKIGNKVSLACGTYSPPDGPATDYALGFILGAFQGDGSFGRKGFVKFTLSKYEKATVIEEIKQRLQEAFGIDHISTTRHHESENTIIVQVRRWGLYRFLKECDLKSGHIPIMVRRGSKQMIGGYLAGLFATDGCANDGRLQMSTRWDTLAHEVQALLFYLGIPTSVCQLVTGAGSYKPNEIHWTLFVRTGKGTERLTEIVGEIPGKEFREHTRRRGVSNGVIQEFEIVAIEGAVKNYPDKRVSEPVYDVVNTETGAFLANGIIVHNCLDYHKQFLQCHFPVSMQRFYGAQYVLEMDIQVQYVPYAFDPHIHYWLPHRRRTHDVTLITGLLYQNRHLALEALRAAGLSVRHEVGLLYEEGTAVYNQGLIALNWSSRCDLPMRFWEGLAYRNVVLTNRVPDLELFPEFQEDVHYLAFDDLHELLEKAIWAVDHPLEAQRLAERGYAQAWIGRHTYTRRALQILNLAGIKT